MPKNGEVAKEKLRVIDIIKENSAMVVAIGGFVWLIYSAIIIPLKELEYSVSDILNNHLKSIQDEQISATTERKEQRELIMNLNESVIRLEEQIKLLK